LQCEVFVKNYDLRSMLSIVGPFVPMEIMVPKAVASQALACIEDRQAEAE